MVRSKWLAVGVAAFAMAAAGIGAFVSAQTGEVVAEAPCVNCDGEAIPIVVLPDGTLHPDTVARQDALKQKREARMEEVSQKARERFHSWEGTKAFVPDYVPAEARGLHNVVAQIFDADLSAPDERLRQFSKYIDGQPIFKCVGWSVKVVSVTPNENGWEATVHVRPELAKESGGRVFTPAHTIEKWQIAADGTPTVLDVREGNGFNGFKGVISN